MLTEIAGIADAEAVDLVLVAGDLFDTAAPTAESERIVYDALLGLAEVAPVLVVAGNHDSPRRLDAVARLLALGRITVATAPRGPGRRWRGSPRHRRHTGTGLRSSRSCRSERSSDPTH